MARRHYAGVALERVGLLIVRAWVEPESPSPLRARLSCTTDVQEGMQQILTLAEVEAVEAAVSAWLDRVLRAGLGP